MSQVAYAGADTATESALELPAPLRTEHAVDAATWTRADFQCQIEPHLRRLHRLCLTLARNRVEAEDLLQNALVKAYLHRDSFAGKGSLVSWLYGIVRHEHIETIRTARRRRSLLELALDRCSDVLGSMLGTERAQEETPEDVAIVQQEGQTLLACLRLIREPFRTAVLLCDIEEMPYEEAAQALGVAIGTVKSRHARGRAMLREAYARRQQRIETEGRGR